MTEIGGDANFLHSRIKNLGNLTKIGGFANFACTHNVYAENLTEIGGDADFDRSEGAFFKNLKKICGNADFRDSGKMNLGNLAEIGGTVYAYIGNSNVEQLKKIKAGTLDIHKAPTPWYAKSHRVNDAYYGGEAIAPNTGWGC